MSDQRNAYNMMMKKKKNRRKKKNPNLVTANRMRPPLMVNPNPGATLEGLKTLANFLQLHQRLNQSKPSDDPKPLMSGPRFGVKFNSTFSQPLLKEPAESTVTQSKNTEEIDQKPPIGIIKKEEPDESDQLTAPTIKKPNADNLTNLPKPFIKKELKTITEKQSQSKTQMKQNNKGKQTNQQFDDFEIYDSPSFINFDESEKVVELNDDNLFQVQGERNNMHNEKKKIYIKKGFNFQKKLQQQFAKKMENKNLENFSPATTEIKSEQVSPKIANEELHEGISADIKTVVQDNIKFNTIKQENVPKYSMEGVFYEQERLPKGIPRSFLYQRSIENAQSQTSTENTNNYNPYSSYSEYKFNESNVEVKPQAYSPTDVYDEMQSYEEVREGSESPDAMEPGQKRISAFQRLGPLSQTKKPKLTINLNLNKDRDVREVVDEAKINIPVHERDYIINSTNEIVTKYLPLWPWKKAVPIRKSVTARSSKTVMMLEKEQMEEIYEKDNQFIMIVVTGYPPFWTKEEVLNLMLDNLKKKSFIPCFIEHTTKECKLLVVRSRASLLALHSLSFLIRGEGVELSVTVCVTSFTMANLDFIPRFVLRKILALKYDENDGKLDLKEFTLDKDLSHFIYYPLHHQFNQSELLKIQSGILWNHLNELDLSNNNIDSIESFELEKTTPNLKVLNLSNNRLDKALLLLPCRYIPLQKLYLQGNPLCLDYIDSEYYIRVVKTMFSSLKELDGVPIIPKGNLPDFKKNYSIEEAHSIVSKFLEVFFPLLECEADDRHLKDLYSKYAVMTVTYRNKLRYNANKNIRNLLIKSQSLLEGNLDEIEGSSSIDKLIKKWPNLQHDPSTFTVDVMFHNEYSTIFKVTGILKLSANSLAEDEPVLAFSRNIHLKTTNGYQYKIYNEMLYWDEPSKEYGNSAFKTLMVPKKVLSLKFETAPDEECKKRLVVAFMTLTELDETASERCLETKSWHFHRALEYFSKLLKEDELHSLVT